MSQPFIPHYVINVGTSSETEVKTSPTSPLPVQITPGTTTTAATFVRGNKAPASTSVPEALASAGTYVRTVTIFAQRASRVANAASVYIDSTSGDGTQQIELVPGTSITITALDGKVIDLGSIYVDSTTVTDGVYYFGLL